jgi:hypothetical protein
MNHSSKRGHRRRKSRRGKGPRTRPNVDVLSSLFGDMGMSEKKVVKKTTDDMSKLENLFSRLKTSIKKPRKSKSRGTKQSRRLARNSRKSNKMEM